MFNHLKIGVFILVFSIPFMIFGVNLNSQRILRLSKGNYFFEKTRNSPDISEIIISFPNKNKISIVKKGDLWHIKEADDYYASFLKINTLVSLIRNTIIYRADIIKNNKLSVDTKNSIKMTSIDKSGNHVDEATIIPINDGNKHHYALLNNDNFLYQISGDFNISSNAIDWLQMPLLKILAKEIKEIKCDKFHLYKRFSDDLFVNVGTNKTVNYVDSFINNLWYLSADKVYHSVNFKRNEYQRLQTYEIKLFNGIIYIISFYKKGKEIVINIKLDKDLLMSKDGIKWLDENRVLYDGWFFSIPPMVGEVLINYTI